MTITAYQRKIIKLMQAHPDTQIVSERPARNQYHALLDKSANPYDVIDDSIKSTTLNRLIEGLSSA